MSRLMQERGYALLAASLDRDAAYAGFAPINRSSMPPPITTPWVRFGPAVRVMSAGCTTCPGSTVEGRMGIRDGLQGLGAVPAGGYVGAIGQTVSFGAIGRAMGPPHRSGAHIRHAMTFAALGSAFGSTETDICTGLRTGMTLATMGANACDHITDATAKAVCKAAFVLANAGVAAGCAQVDAADARQRARAATAAGDAAAAAQAAQAAADAEAARQQIAADAAAARAQTKAFTPQTTPATSYVPILAAGALALGVAWFIFK